MNYPVWGHRPAINRLPLNFLTIWEAIYDQNSISLTHVDTLTSHYNNPLISNMWNQYSLCWRRFNSLGPSVAIWRWRSWSTLVQVMACCLTAPSHYLNQCWLIICKVLWHSSEDIIKRRFEDTNQWSKIENCIFKITLRSPRGHWVKETCLPWRCRFVRRLHYHAQSSAEIRGMVLPVWPTLM